MSQTKKWSVIEIVTGTALKFIWAMFLWQVIVAPLFDYEVSISQNVRLTLIFTVSSVITGYLIRRLFNYIEKLLGDYYGSKEERSSKEATSRL